MSPVGLQWALLPSSGKQANQPPAKTGSSQDEAGTQSVGCRVRLGPNCLVILFTTDQVLHRVTGALGILILNETITI